MRRLVSFALLLLLSLLLFGVTGCGSGSASAGPPTSVAIAPSTISLNVGQVQQVSAVVKDASGNQVLTETLDFSSSNSSVVSTSPSGLLCAGAWDATFVHCTPGPVGTANLTVKTSPSNLTSSAVTVYVHQPADSIVVGPVGTQLACGVQVPPATSCVSKGATAPANTLSYTAIACSNSAAICAPSAAPCQLPENTIGAFDFGSSNTLVATVAPDTANPNTVAVATATGPGLAKITANLSGTSSLSADFITCAPASINIHLSGQATTTALSMAKGATNTLVADILDVNNIAMTNIPLNWVSSSIPAATVTSAGVVTAVAPGTANIVAACAPPSCNAGTTQALYSNVVSTTVTGAGNATTVYVTSSDAGTSTIIPISTADNSVGTAINLPTGFTAPNSFVFAPSGAKAFLGTASGLLIFDPGTGGFTPIVQAKGKVLRVSPDSNSIAIVDTTPGVNNFYVYNIGSTTLQTFSISGATAAEFTPDSTRLFVVTSGGRVYEIANGTFSNNVASGPATDVSLLASGSFAYVADLNGEVYSTCTNELADMVFPPPPDVTPILIRAAAKPISANTRLQMIAIVGSQIEQIDVTPGAPGSPCPAPPINAATPWPFPGVAAFTPVQLLITPDSSKAFVTASDVAKLLVYTIGTDSSTGTASTISLAGAATGATTAGVTLDSSTVYVGVNGNEVQAFKVSDGSLIKEIPVSLTPKLVAIQPK